MLESNLEVCRFLYNHFIEEGYTNEYEMNLHITELKDAYPELNNYHSKMLQMVSKQVSSIYKALKTLKKGRGIKLVILNQRRKEGTTPLRIINLASNLLIEIISIIYGYQR